MIYYYVDPGQGFVFAQNTSFFWGMILGLFGALFIYFKFFFRFLKKRFWVLLCLCGIIFLGSILMHKPQNLKKVVILGIDAMDPKITEQLMQSGKLPNLASLKAQGSYSSLLTSNPSESAVAWTSFSTGLNPGGHGIFDFIMRDPENYQFYLSLNEIVNFRGKVKVISRKKGKDFWEILSLKKIPSFIYFCPNTFPVKPLLGKLFSGMGVPDITGTMGRFSFYTAQPLAQEDKFTRGRVISVFPKDNLISTQLYGPSISKGNLSEDSAIPLKMIIRPSEGDLILQLQGEKIILKESSWSGWQRVSFKTGPFSKVFGIVRFYLKSLKPYFQLYASPVNFNPERPLFPISYPKGLAAELSKSIGLYYTQGMPYDTWALTEGRLDEKAFLEQADEVLRENELILDLELKEFKGGVLFFYFESLDIIQHMFWRYTDPRHPLYEENPLYKESIMKYYQKIDALVGKVLASLDKDAILMVISDHGFSSFRKSVNINRWLLDRGYLSLKNGADANNEFFEDVDWSKTKAYALGFGGVYINRVGRELYGIVNPVQADALGQEIKQGLEQFSDPKDGEKVVKKVYLRQDIFRGPCFYDAPDLFVGFNTGFRASWQTALGAVGEFQIQENKKKWSGDHLVDPSLVPGVIFVNRKVAFKNPSILDIAPTILELFGIPKLKQMEGNILFKDENKTI